MIAFDFKNNDAEDVEPLYADDVLEICADCFGYVHACIDLSDPTMFRNTFNSASLRRQVLATMLGTSISSISWCARGIHHIQNRRARMLELVASEIPYLDFLATTSENGRNIGVCLTVANNNSIQRVETAALEDKIIFTDVVKKALNNYYVVSLNDQETISRRYSQEHKAWLIRHGYKCNVVVAPSSLGHLLKDVNAVEELCHPLRGNRVQEVKEARAIRDALMRGDISFDEALYEVIQICSDSVCPYALAIYLLR